MLNDKQATIFNIQRMSTEDGPGIRTTVFFKGCNLSCIWCHNPESINPQPQLIWQEIKCIGCKSCQNICSNNALNLTKEGIIINREICKGCGKCADECPSTALEIIGKKWSIKELADEIEKDKAFFKNSQGGITLSGGEPLLQVEFVTLLLKECKERELHTALDTSGMCGFSSVENVLNYTDLILYDIKEIDTQKHKKWTGVHNDKILENLILISKYIKENKKPTLWIRTPVIPDATATEENIKGIGEFIAKNISPFVDRWELCAFNKLCESKYRRLGINWLFKDTELLTQDKMNYFLEIAKASGVNPEIIFATGITKTL